MLSGLGDITGESAASSRPSALAGIHPFTPNLLSISERSDAFPGLRLDPVLFGPRPGACPRTEGKAGEDGKGDEEGRGGSSSEREGWNKSETDARTCVIQHFEREQRPTFPCYSLYLPAALFSYVQLLCISRDESQHTTAAWLTSSLQCVRNPDLW